jgi:hemerythrin
MNAEPKRPIPWLEVLETGVVEIDNDHKSLIEDCNGLTALMDTGGDWQSVVAAARALAEKCAEHFRSEEAVLERTRFSRHEHHKAQHRRIESQFAELVGLLANVDGSQSEHRVAARSIRDTLLDVLFRHDLDYKSHLQHVAGR